MAESETRVLFITAWQQGRTRRFTPNDGGNASYNCTVRSSTRAVRTWCSAQPRLTGSCTLHTPPFPLAASAVPGLHPPAVQCSDSVHRRAPCVQVAVEVARSAHSVFMCKKNTPVCMGTGMQKRRNARWAVGLFTLLSCVTDIVAGTAGEQQGLLLITKRASLDDKHRNSAAFES